MNPYPNLEHRTQKQESIGQRNPAKLRSQPPESFSLLPPMDSEIKFSFNDHVACNKTLVSWLLGYCVGNTALPPPPTPPEIMKVKNPIWTPWENGKKAKATSGTWRTLPMKQGHWLYLFYAEKWYRYMAFVDLKPMVFHTYTKPAALLFCGLSKLHISPIALETHFSWVENSFGILGKEVWKGTVVLHIYYFHPVMGVVLWHQEICTLRFCRCRLWLQSIITGRNIYVFPYWEAPTNQSLRNHVTSSVELHRLAEENHLPIIFPKTSRKPGRGASPFHKARNDWADKQEESEHPKISRAAA